MNMKSMYMLEVRHWSSCSPLLRRCEDAPSTWPWASENVGVRQRAGAI